MQDTSLLINPGEAKGTWKLSSIFLYPCVRKSYKLSFLAFFSFLFFFPLLLCAYSYCLESSLNRTKARGKVLVCRHAESSLESKREKSIVVKEVGAAGMILIDEEDKNVAIPFVLPSAIVGRRTGAQILSYINRTRFVL